MPENAVQIKNIWDLVIVNPQYYNSHKPKYGGKLYIKSALEDHYEEYDFNKTVSSDKIKKYIQSGQLYFVKKEEE